MKFVIVLISLVVATQSAPPARCQPSRNMKQCGAQNRVNNNVNSKNGATPGVEYKVNPDGSFSASFSAAQALNAPGGNSAIGFSQTYNFGPMGSSFSGSQTGSFNSNLPGGSNFGFSQSNAAGSSQGPNGFSSSGSNAASNYINNPLFSSSNANANAYANSNQFNNNLGLLNNNNLGLANNNNLGIVNNSNRNGLLRPTNRDRHRHG